MSTQQILLGAGAIPTKPYVDDVFATTLYEGNQSDNHHIQNDVDLTKGGLVWMKDRESSENHILVDSEWSMNSSRWDYLISNLTGAPYSGPVLNSFETDGFKLNSNWYANQTGRDYASWSFKRSKGFFDVVKFEEATTGDQTINHQLGCIPGMIIFKRYDATGSWYVWHFDGYGEHLTLNSNDDKSSTSVIGYVTATSFRVKFGNIGAGIGSDYVAYVFAGGESPSSGSISLNFNSSAYNRATIPDNDDFDLGTGDFTIECWVKVANVSNTAGTIFCLGDKDSNNSIRVEVNNNQTTYFYADGSARLTFLQAGTLAKGQWRHIAVTKSSNVLRYFVDGVSCGSTYTQTNSVGNGINGFLSVGARGEATFGAGWIFDSYFDGAISNFRIVKGTAVYTSSFRPPTAPLTNITNTVLLFLNATGFSASTVTPATISGNGTMGWLNNGPFDDPAASIFGEAEDQPVIKAGSYIGDGSSSGDLHVTLGFEPQWVLIKNYDEHRDWQLFDSLRGIPTWGGIYGDKRLHPNNYDQESAQNANYLELTPTGFRFRSNSMDVNGSGDKMIYLAIRRPDPLVSKPRTATELFSMVTGVASATNYAFASGFPVDMGIYRKPAVQSNWSFNARVMGQFGLSTFNDDDQFYANSWWDSNSRFGPTDATEYDSDYQSWAWRRSAGFTTVAYEGNAIAGREIAHDLGPNNVPEMMWIKNRYEDEDWTCYHKGLNGGTNPSHWYVKLNNENVQVNEDTIFNDTEPTSTHFTVGANDKVNKSDDYYIALLFSSVPEISKCGYYEGSDSGVTLTTGFQPRFLIIRRITGSQNARWTVFDTLRGLGTTSQNALFLDATESQSGVSNLVTTSSTGFSVTYSTYVSMDNEKFIYYAHA